MFDVRISIADSIPVETLDGIETLESMANALRALAPVTHADFAAYQAAPRDFRGSLAERYAASSPIVRRRCDALLREAETVGTTGLRLIASRAGRLDAGTIAAARFLGSSLSATLRKLDQLTAPRAA